jgi:hypothetical protein
VDHPDSPARGEAPRVHASDSAALGGDIAERYQVQSTLGRGGMATVYEVVELATGQRLALKRMRKLKDPAKHQRNLELFSREFHALSQLSHPRIVQAFDFGIDARGPYYTMELLDGGDLQRLAPLPWRTACAIARELCSALSLLHSRRLVHRDLSPRNVRRTTDGLAKLFDFGALAPLGPQKVLVGTPPCCAPEALALQPLDGRTDLFALGATLYFMLVGRHAYLATQFAQLHDAWQLGYPRASELVADIPPALDLLLADLLRLEPYARLSNAAEVIQRLCAIDGQPLDAELQVAASYLSLPTLVGRDPQLRRAQRSLARDAHGSSVVIEGAPGMGRSRFLDRCLLDATLLGATVVRVDADDARSGDYGALRALARQLSRLLPRATQDSAEAHRAVLAEILPEPFANPLYAPPPPAVTSPRPQLQAAARSWLTDIAKSSTLVIGVDDFDRIDEPSAALLSLLAHDPQRGVHLAVTMSNAQPVAPEQEVLLDASVRVELTPLTLEDSENLLKSLFNDAREIGAVAHRFHELAAGNPRDLLQLAQHLVAQGLARYEGGCWSLALGARDAGLPSSMAQALRERVAAISGDARELASALALCPDVSFTLEECATLCQQGGETLMTALSQLAFAELLAVVEGQYRLARTQWAPALRATLAPVVECRLQARLGKVFLERGQHFRASQHLLRAGDDVRALDVLVAHAAASQEQTASSPELFSRYARSLPADWYDTYVQAFRACARLRRPRRDAMTLRGRLAGVAPAFGIADTSELAPLFEQLRQDSGLDDFEAASAALPPLARIQLGQQRAQARFDACDPEQRVHPPATALRIMVRALGAATTRVANGLDVMYMRSLPRLGAFAELSASLRATRDLMDGVEARYMGQFERARALYMELLALIEQPGNAGWDASYATIIRLAVMTALGIMDACLGRSASLDWAERAGANPDYRVNAEHTRLIYHLYQGDIETADDCRRQVERLRLQSQQLYPSTHMVWEIDAHMMADDLTHMREKVEQCARLSTTFEAWRAVHDYARSEYQRILSDYAGALTCIEGALARVAPGEHVLWASMAMARVRALSELGRHAEALHAAEAYVASADAHRLQSVAERLRLMLALCQARARLPEARLTVQAVLERYRARQVSGLCLGFAHEIAARVASQLGHESAMLEHAEACRVVYCRHANPALLLKYEHLMRELESPEPTHSGDMPPADAAAAVTESKRVSLAFSQCNAEEQRSRLALLALLRHSRAIGGLLYVVTGAGLRLVAAAGEHNDAHDAATWIANYLAAQTYDVTTCVEAESPNTPVPQQYVDERGRAYRPVILGHNVSGRWTITAVALLAPSDRIPYRPPSQVATMLSRLWAEHPVR